MVQIIAQDRAAASRCPAGPAPGMSLGPREQGAKLASLHSLQTEPLGAENNIQHVEAGNDVGFATALVGEMSKGSKPFSKVEQMRVWDDLQVQGSMHRVRGAIACSSGLLATPCSRASSRFSLCPLC